MNCLYRQPVHQVQYVDKGLGLMPLMRGGYISCLVLVYHSSCSQYALQWHVYDTFLKIIFYSCCSLFLGSYELGLLKSNACPVLFVWAANAHLSGLNLKSLLWIAYINYSLVWCH